MSFYSATGCGGGRFILLFVLMMLSSLSTTMAEIRNYKITSESTDLSIARKVFIDSFRLEKSLGCIQLKVTDISFPISSNFSNNSDHDLSQIGFFLAQNRLSSFSARCYLHNGDSNKGVLVLYTFNHLFHNNNNNYFDLTFYDINKTADYVLYFQNCVDDHLTTPIMNVQSTMYNLDVDSHRPLYLSPNKTFLIKTNSFFSLVYLSLFCFWGYYILHLKNNKLATVTWIHILMLLVPFFKAWSLTFNVLRHYYILYVGCGQCYPSLLLTFASNFLSDTPLILLLVLICTGLSSVIPLHLLPVKKRFLLVGGVVLWEMLHNSLGLLLLQFMPLANEIFYMYPGFFLQVGILGRWCLLSLAFNSSTDSLTELGTSTYGKASTTVKYIQLFCFLCITYMSYCSIHTHFLYFLEAFTSHLFLSVLLRELLSLAFYALVASKLSPELEKQKLLLIDDDAEKAAQKVLLKITKLRLTLDNSESLWSKIVTCRSIVISSSCSRVVC